ncbi:MAG TPA: condensation domain-containing protein, partial [Longimicrobium sp.]|nr:condensation domain-containing protein [Longimicrobium sp.]
PGSAAYNMPYALRLRGALDEAALERSLTEVVGRHEALRTRFPSVDGEPAQVIDPAGPVPLDIVELGHLAEAEREAALRALATAEARRPFDLAAGPLLRGTLARLGPEEHAVLFTLHHVVSDGWSMGVLVREVSELYGAFSRGEPSPLPALPVQYADFAAWQRKWLVGEVLDEQLAWWRERLAGAPPLLEIPTDRPRPTRPSDRGGSVPFTLGEEATGALGALARREGATLFMTLLAGWQLLLARYSGQDDVSVGTPIAGRTRLETEGLIGFFVNTLVLRADLSGDPTFRELLGRVRETTLGAYQHQDIPFERLVEELAPERSLSHAPLFQAMFILQNNTWEALRLGSLDAEALPGGDETAKFDLTLGIAETGDRLAGALSYRADLFDAATAERMTEHLRVLLEVVAAEPDAPLAGVSLVSEAERAALLGSPPAVFPADAPLHDLFAARAARTPGAPALTFEGETLTYAELDRRAEQLAARLAGRGVGTESVVGLCAERSLEMVIALLGILKSGGAYLPLDPENPAARLQYMLSHSGAHVLVAQERF